MEGCTPQKTSFVTLHMLLECYRDCDILHAHAAMSCSIFKLRCIFSSFFFQFTEQYNTFGILYNYINESASTNSLDMWAIHLSYPVIITSLLKNVKF
jgi:hypothetical protein